ncbi:hypothetical protein E2C01_053072 [Portunus trituberculatus]|uniref:Uncharacterized protein n=1 Tax=Portunus trituberculatus TaxID=210409 RepID=A0A5B7GPC4_PORTR|nr:hypothetical protein [Portunus trituberculatus]
MMSLPSNTHITVLPQCTYGCHELNPKYEREDDLNPKNNFHSPYHNLTRQRPCPEVGAALVSHDRDKTRGVRGTPQISPWERPNDPDT